MDSRVVSPSTVHPISRVPLPTAPTGGSGLCGVRAIGAQAHRFGTAFTATHMNTWTTNGPKDSVIWAMERGERQHLVLPFWSTKRVYVSSSRWIASSLFIGFSPSILPMPMPSTTPYSSGISSPQCRMSPYMTVLYAGMVPRRLAVAANHFSIDSGLCHVYGPTDPHSPKPTQTAGDRTLTRT